MSMFRSVSSATLTVLVISCGSSPGEPNPSAQPKPAPPSADGARRVRSGLDRSAARVDRGPRLAALKAEAKVPRIGGGGRAPMFMTGGSFNVVNATVAGSASYVDAPSFDPNSPTPPSVFGGGDFSITVNGTAYSAASADSMSGVFSDDQGTDYLVLSLFVETPDPSGGSDLGTVVHTVVLASDFAPGATIALDGVDRLAFFGHGHVDLEEPELVAIAESGSVSFSATSVLAGPVSAALSGDFAEVTLPSAPPPPPVGINLVAGRYTLSFNGQVQVQCDGTLSGHEADFSAITAADLGFTGGPVSLAQSSSTSWTLDGAGGFGGPIQLDVYPDQPDGILTGGAVGSGTTGPDATSLVEVGMMLDGAGATAARADGFGVAVYADAAQTGTCMLGVEASLTP